MKLLPYIVAIVIASQATGLLWLWTERSKYDGIVKYLKESQQVIQFSMDKSCFDQFQNSPDGIVRIQLGKK